MLNNILLAIIALSILGIIFIVIRKFPALTSINIKDIPKHQQDEMKVDIIEERINRRFKQLTEILSRILSPLGKFFSIGFNRLYAKTLALEDFYRKESIKQRSGESDVKTKISFLLKEGEELIRQENYPEAEKKFIEVVSLDRQNITGFESLGRVYHLKKEYNLALETFEYILKINPRDSTVLCELGEIAQAQGDNIKAISYFHKALDIEPSSPKCLSLLIETAILEGNKNTAKKALKKMKEVNPENKNLKEYEKKIREL